MACITPYSRRRRGVEFYEFTMMIVIPRGCMTVRHLRNYTAEARQRRNWDNVVCHVYFQLSMRGNVTALWCHKTSLRWNFSGRLTPTSNGKQPPRISFLSSNPPVPAVCPSCSPSLPFIHPYSHLSVPCGPLGQSRRWSWIRCTGHKNVVAHWMSYTATRENCFQTPCSENVLDCSCNLIIGTVYRRPVK